MDTDVVVVYFCIGSSADTHALDVRLYFQTGGVLINKESGHSLVGGNRLISQGKYQEGVGKTGVGGENLCAVDDIVVAILLGKCFCAGDVRTCIGLCQAKAADLGSVNEGTKPFLFLLGSRVLLDDRSAQRGVHGDGNTGAAADLGDLFHLKADFLLKCYTR